MKIIFIRHGESARNRGLPVDSEENYLTAKGVQQAIETAAKLAPMNIDAIYCSNVPRCVQTLDEILRIRDDNMPIHLTSLVGPKLKKENYEKLKSRMELFLDDLKYDHKENETVVVISHLKPISMALFLIKGKQEAVANGDLLEVIL